MPLPGCQAGRVDGHQLVQASGVDRQFRGRECRRQPQGATSHGTGLAADKCLGGSGHLGSGLGAELT